MRISNFRGFGTACLVALMATAVGAHAQDASFTAIPAQNTMSYSVWARGVSADGSVVVGVEEGTVFRWTKAGSTEYLSGSNWNNTFAAAVSADGATILSTVDDGTGVFSAALFTDAAGWTSIGGLQAAPPSGGDGLSTGYSISGDGSIAVGLAWVGGGWDAEAFIWNENDGMTGLGRPVDANSRANDISADGSVIVGWYEHEVNRCRRPARWTPDGTVDVFLGTEICGEAMAISVDGSVIVGTATVPGNDYPTAFRYTDVGGWEDLGKLVPHPFHSAIASGIAENGTIVGLSGDSAAQNWTGFLWTEEDGMKSMSDVLTGLGVTAHDGWWLGEARDISADGTTIVGTAIDPSFFLRGFVATIPVGEVFADGFESGDTSSWTSTAGGR